MRSAYPGRLRPPGRGAHGTGPALISRPWTKTAVMAGSRIPRRSVNRVRRSAVTSSPTAAAFPSLPAKGARPEAATWRRSAAIAVSDFRCRARCGGTGPGARQWAAGPERSRAPAGLTTSGTTPVLLSTLGHDRDGNSPRLVSSPHPGSSRSTQGPTTSDQRGGAPVDSTEQTPDWPGSKDEFRRWRRSSSARPTTRAATRGGRGR